MMSKVSDRMTSRRIHGKKERRRPAPARRRRLHQNTDERQQMLKGDEEHEANATWATTIEGCLFVCDMATDLR